MKTERERAPNWCSEGLGFDAQLAGSHIFLFSKKHKVFYSSVLNLPAMKVALFFKGAQPLGSCYEIRFNYGLKVLLLTINVVN